MKNLLLGICLLAAVPVAGAPLSVSVMVDLPGTFYIASDVLSGGSAGLGGFNVMGLLGDDRMLDASVTAEAYGETYFNDFGLEPNGLVQVDLTWRSAPLVILGGTGDGLAYFPVNCLGSSALCNSNLDLNTGMLAFTFGVPFVIEISSTTTADFVSAENVTVAANVYVDTTWAQITDLDGNQLAGARLLRAPSLGPAETPEPASVALTGLGLAACAWLRARRSSTPS